MADQGFHDPRSISDRLAAAGYGHCSATDDGLHDIVRLDTGEIVGRYRALEACAALLTEQGTA